jgi:hypothetical protein
MTLGFTVVTVAKPFGFTTQQINTSALGRSKAMPVVMKPGKRHESYQAVLEFPNGYGLSIVSSQYTYGGLAALFEVAVYHNEQLCYSTPITSDVLGWQSFTDVAKVIKQAEELPSSSTCSHQVPKEDN